jgi:hypothetical protein
MPDKIEPTSDQLQLVVGLISGLSDADYDPEEEVNKVKNRRQTPQDRLKEAISSKGGFQKHYLELCELAMGTYKHVGRLRAAREIGVDLANFYLKMNQPERALSFFVEACAGYKREGWLQLATNTRLKILDCSQMADCDRYVKTLVLLACSPSLPLDKRVGFQRLIPAALSAIDLIDGQHHLSMSAEEVLLVQTMNMLHDEQSGQSKGVVADSEAKAKIVMKTNLPLPVVADWVELKLRHQPEVSVAKQPIAAAERRASHVKASQVNSNDLESIDYDGEF